MPKAVALARADQLAVVLAAPLELLGRVFAPVVWVLQRSAAALARLFGVDPAPAGIVSYTREDILHSVAAAEDFGAIEQAEEEMLYKVFDFASKEVHEVMVPRPEVVAISVAMPPEEVLAAVIDSPYTRYPAYRESLDDIVGVLHVRDLFSALHDRGIAQVRIEDLLRPPTSSRRPRTSPHCSPTSAASATTWRSWSTSTARRRASSRSRTCSRRSWARSRTSSTCPTSRSSASTTTRSASTARSRSTTSTSSSAPGCRRRTSTRSPASCSGGSATHPCEGDEVEHRNLRFRVLEVEGTRIQRLEVVFEEEEPAALDEREAPAA